MEMKSRGLNWLTGGRGTGEQGPGLGVPRDAPPRGSFSRPWCCLQRASALSPGQEGARLESHLTQGDTPSWGSQHPRTGQVCIIKAWAPSLELRTAGMQHPCFGALEGGRLTEPPGRPPWLPCVWHRRRSQEHSLKHSCVQSGSPAPPQRALPETVTRELRNISQSVRHSQVCCFLLPRPLR